MLGQGQQQAWVAQPVQVLRQQGLQRRVQLLLGQLRHQPQGRRPHLRACWLQLAEQPLQRLEQVQVPLQQVLELQLVLQALGPQQLERHYPLQLPRVRSRQESWQAQRRCLLGKRYLPQAEWPRQSGSVQPYCA